MSVIDVIDFSGVEGVSEGGGQVNKVGGGRWSRSLTEVKEMKYISCYLGGLFSPLKILKN